MRVAMLCLGLLVLFLTPALATSVYRYVDQQGDVHFTQDPGSIPDAYRDSATLYEPPEKGNNAGDGGSFFSFGDSEELPPRRGGSGATAGGQAAAGLPGDTAQVEGASGNAMARDIRQGAMGKIDMNKLREKLKRYPTPLLQKLIVGTVAAWLSGFFWVLLLALLLFGFTLATRRLIPLADGRLRRIFWRWGFPVLSVAAVAGLSWWRYPPHAEIYKALAQALGI